MKLPKLGRLTSAVEVTNVSPHGFWILLCEKEFYLDYEQYPWFKEARIDQIFNVKLLHEDHLYWPDLDIDLERECLEQPEEFPLIYR